MQKFLLLLSLLVLAGGCSRQSQNARLLEKAERAFQAEDYDHAEVAYLNILEKDPSNVRAMGRLGWIYAEQGRFNRAGVWLLKVRKVAPDAFDIRSKLALVYLAGGDLKDAREEAQAVLARNPTDEQAALVLADATGSLSEINDVRAFLEEAVIRSKETAPLKVALGTVESRCGNFESAEGCFKRALELDSKSGAAYSALGILCWAQNNLKDAESAFRAAADLSPFRSPRRLQYARFKMQTGNVSDAKRLLEEMSQKAPDYLPVSVALAEIALAEKNEKECQAWTTRIMARDPGNVEALVLGARMLLVRGEVGQAVTELERIQDLQPEWGMIPYHLALAYLVSNETGKAMASLNRAVYLDPNLNEAVLLLNELRMSKGDSSSVLVSLKGLLQKQPRLAHGYELLTDAFLLQRSPEEALRVLETYARFFPLSAEPVFRSGYVDLQLGRRVEARKAFEKALEMAPDDLRPVEALVNLDLDEKKHEAALQRVQKQLELHPALPGLQVLLARVFAAQQDYKKAEKAWLKALELQPDSYAAYMPLAQLYLRTNQKSQALGTLHEAAEKNPKDVVAWMLIGMIHDQGGEFDDARGAYEHLLAIQPNFSPALNNLAYIYSEHDGQLEKASQLARKARELHPHDPCIADTLGWILYRQGRFSSALELLQESAAKLSTNPEVLFHLGMTQHQLKDVLESEKSLRRALDLKLSGSPALEAKRILNETK